ncbi:MAG TPA: GNAT family N-acetyltransferase [Roseiarcus sp.]|nr:GNAT family N-acetyltransferase [Roseiarcus sp.]
MAAAFLQLRLRSMEIRDARLEDAAEACAVIRRSILELCSLDHRDDPAILERWLANKTPEQVAGWFGRSDHPVLVVTEAGGIVAVGAVRISGEITLNYVSPEARFRGFSRALLAELELRARQFGADACTLNSTETARRFYRSAGYLEQGPPKPGFRADVVYPMIKRLGLRA